MKSNALFLCFLFLVIIVGCDKIDEPYGKKPSGTVDTTTTYVRKVLVEDFTGHTCGNCPRAAESLEQLYALFPGQIVSMGVHAGFFAEPGGAEYPEDFRTSVGNELDQFYGVSAASLPKGLVNRKSFGGAIILEHTDWKTKVPTIASIPPDANLKITAQFNASSRILTANIDTRILLPLTGDLKLALYITEDSVRANQKDYDAPGDVIENYVHRHMLRTSMNSAWGEPLSSATNYAAAELFSKNLSITLPVEWNAQHIGVLAVLYRDAENKEVIQAEYFDLN
jgi:thiol-disulfide isomerase/thioredoxin